LDEFYLVAQIIAPGKEGFVKLQTSPDFETSIKKNSSVYIDFWGKKKKFIVEDFIRTKNSVFVKFLNFDDERDLQVLIDRKIFIYSKNFQSSEKSRLYSAKFIGAEVIQNGNIIGIIKDIFTTPANDVAEIQKQDGEIILLPFLDVYFESLYDENKKVILKPDVGFYDDED
jgi:16S rRNA processing protein RimM